MPLPATAILREPIVTVLARPHFIEPSHLSVRRVGESTAGERLAEYVGRLRHMSQANPAGRSTAEYLRHLQPHGRDDVLAHVTYTLLCDGISRALAQALGEHHGGLTMSPLSPHDVDEADAQFVMPPAIIDDVALEGAWTMQIETALACYVAMVRDILTRYAWVDDKLKRRRMARDAARSVLPHSTAARIVMTGSARAWRDVIVWAAHDDTELELRRLCVAVVRVLKPEAPSIFADVETYVAADRRDAVRVSPSAR